MSISRRDFMIGGAAAGGLGAFSGLDALLKLPRVSAAETVVTPDIVRFTSGIEPYVRLIEDTPRNKVVEVMAHQLRQGMSYRQFLGSLFLAGIRNVNPQPPGFSFHCVFMIHSCNYLAKMGPPEERYLPLFLALDDFKKAQDFDSKRDEGDFGLRETTGTLPSGQGAWEELHAAMDSWDEPRADRAITAIARTFELDKVFEQLWEYGARDYRNIGHKIIFVAHAHRTLAEIGWEHGEATPCAGSS
ncbi:MAG TPA: twin-arginine translocation signal domain-containing protein [Candidatus Hydrogenedentes bacterium]|nr:twin-arginine translocation signal domain-containing protein [Candidatus Hydrogenedentota bacterium]